MLFLLRMEMQHFWFTNNAKTVVTFTIVQVIYGDNALMWSDKICFNVKHSFSFNTLY